MKMYLSTITEVLSFIFVYEFGCCQAHRGLPVGFLLLQYSVLYTVESLFLLYLLFIYFLLCSNR